MDSNGHIILDNKYINIYYHSINDKTYLICQDESKRYGMFIKENNMTDFKEVLKFTYTRDRKSVGRERVC